MSGPGTAGAVRRHGSGLRRFLEPPPPREERCELCDSPLPEEHRHLVDTRRRGLVCACAACATLLVPATTGGGRFRAVPDRCLTDPALDLPAATWQGLGIPVSMAFFFHNSELDRLVVLYPSPAGATESEVDPDVWRAAFGDSPLAAALRPDVEALLVRREEGRTECFLVPVDAAYELVGRLRLNWRGFDGGAQARATLADFFDRLARRATGVTGERGTTWAS